MFAGEKAAHYRVVIAMITRASRLSGYVRIVYAFRAGIPYIGRALRPARSIRIGRALTREEEC